MQRVSNDLNQLITRVTMISIWLCIKNHFNNGGIGLLILFYYFIFEFKLLLQDIKLSNICMNHSFFNDNKVQTSLPTKLVRQVIFIN